MTVVLREDERRPVFVEELAPGVNRMSASKGWPRPHIGVCGSMHGNEPCGAEAIERLTNELRIGAHEVGGGTLFFIHANPEATSQRRRHTEQGDDLNRLWDFSFVESLRTDAWGYEHHRALALTDYIRDLDVFLDLHSAASATPPFGVSNGVSDINDLATRMGLSFLVKSWHGLADKVVIGFLASQGVPALSVECGAHEHPEVSQNAYEIALHFLRATGGLNAVADPPTNEVRTVRVVETITRPSPEFRFSSPWAGFDELEPGALVGRDRVTEIRTTARCYAVLPNQDVEVGDDVIYLAVDD